MRRVLYLTALTLLLFLYNSQAGENSICRNCSLISDSTVNMESPQTYSSLNTSEFDKNYSTAAHPGTSDQSRINKGKNHDLDDILFKSQIDRLDDILYQYKSDEESFIASTKKNIDLLSGFRTGVKGQDVFVPLGFFVYLNKKF